MKSQEAIAQGLRIIRAGGACPLRLHEQIFPGEPPLKVAAWVLHEIMGFSAAEVAQMLNKSKRSIIYWSQEISELRR
jgi:hypothetical protein